MAGRGPDVRSLGASVIAFGSRNTDLAVRIAVFTAVAHCCLGLLFVAGYQVYVILETFFRPLMWALLTGTFLFPFKSFLADLVKNGLSGLKTTSTPILVGLALTPVKLADKGLDAVGAEIMEFFRHHGWKILYALLGIISYFVIYFYVSPYLSFLGTIIRFVLKLTTKLSTHTVWLIIIPYVAALHFFWKQGYRRHLMIVAVPLWILIGFYLYFLLDELAVPVYLFIVITVALGWSESSGEQTAPLGSKASASSFAAETKRRSSTVPDHQYAEVARRSVDRDVDGNRRSSVSESLTLRRFPAASVETKTTVRPAGAVPDSTERIVSKTIVKSELVPDIAVEEIVVDEEDSHPRTPTMMSVLSDVRHRSNSFLRNTYDNVKQVLRDEEFSTTESDEAVANSEILRHKLKELGMGSDEVPTGTRYLRYVVWAFFLLQAITTYYVIPLLLVPVLYRFVKLIIRRKRLLQKCKTVLQPALSQVRHWTDDRSEVVAPLIVQKLMQSARIGDRKVLSILESVTDETVSAILICLMFLVGFIGTVIGMLQIENETSHMVRVSGNMFDDIFENHPEFYEWLPEADDFRVHFQTALESAYVYSRDWVIKTVRSTIADKNETRVMEIERDLTLITDRFYHYYVAQNLTNATTELADTSTGLANVLGMKLGDPLMWFSASGTNSSIWDFDIWGAMNTDVLSHLTEYLDLSNVQAFLKNHVETFVSVLESVWAILRSNIALILSLSTTIASVTLTYFSAFLNFILCAVIYLTTLFYLLSSSGRRYKPIELISAASKYYPGAEAVADIVEDTVSGIFAVSIKIGTFYGFYTWVLLSFCGVYVRFIPSMLAALFAVCPLVPTYVVCLPAAFAFWFRGDYVTMVILCAGAYLPKLFVDAAIYGDLKAANPYIFGLSVAGGLVTLGIEGVVVGPLMLCFFIVVMECYKLTIQSRFLVNDEMENEPVVANGAILRAKDSTGAPVRS